MRAANLFTCAAILVSQASVAEAAERRRYELPGGRLGDALVALGRQGGVSIGLSDPELASRRVAPVRGVMSLRDALRRLLNGHPAAYVMIDPVTVRVFRQPVRRAGASPPTPPQERRREPVRPASPATPGETQEIIVTASKRPIRVGSFPGAVQLIEGDALVASGGLTGTNALVARLPALTSTHFGPGRNKLFIRGIADSSFSGPTQATVGQYLGETRLNYNAPDPDLRLYDLERVEVLSGPHGTLYGAGSLGGIIRLVPNAPRLSEVQAAASGGASYTQHGDPGADAAGMLNLPLARDRIGLRLAAYAASESGYIDDLERGLRDVNRVKILGGRAAARANAGSGWIVDLGLTGQRIRGNDAQYADRDAAPLTRRSRVKQNFQNDFGLADLAVRKDWGALRLVAAGGVVRHATGERFDATRRGGAPAVVLQSNRATLVTLESRLSREASNGSGWLAGASFVSNSLSESRSGGSPNAPIRTPGVDNGISEGALFGEGSMQVAAGITATIGGRITYSRLSGAALGLPGQPIPASVLFAGKRRETMFLPAAALAASLRRDLLVFLRYQEAYRPGGLAVRGPSVQRFRHDDVSSVEAGVRYGGPALSRFDAALSLVYTRWNDVQADVVDFAGAPTRSNIGTGRIYTADLSLGWRPLPGLTLETAAVFNDSLVINREPSIIGVIRSPLPNVARVNARLGIEYRASVARADLLFWSAARYVGQSRLGIGAVLGQTQGEWLDVSLGARASRGRHAFTLTLGNLLDQAGNRFALGSAYRLSEQRQITPLRPRTLRLGWETSF